MYTFASDLAEFAEVRTAREVTCARTRTTSQHAVRLDARGAADPVLEGVFSEFCTRSAPSTTRSRSAPARRGGPVLPVSVSPISRCATGSGTRRGRRRSPAGGGRGRPAGGGVRGPRAGGANRPLPTAVVGLERRDLRRRVGPRRIRARAAWRGARACERLTHEVGVRRARQTHSQLGGLISPGKRQPQRRALGCACGFAHLGGQGEHAE